MSAYAVEDSLTVTEYHRIDAEVKAILRRVRNCRFRMRVESVAGFTHVSVARLLLRSMRTARGTSQ